MSPQLDAMKSSDVASRSEIEVDIGGPNRKMFILSGIARPEWRVTDDETLDRKTFTVNLRKTALAVDQSTVHIGLASIGNGETDFAFACDEGKLELDPNTQELLLHAVCALQGDPSALNRFSYQVVATVTTQATGISGRILWRRSVFDGSALRPPDVAQLFRVSANQVEVVERDGFRLDRYTPVAFGLTGALDTDGDDFVLPYQIPGAPYNLPLTVKVEVTNRFNPVNQPVAQQIAGPRPVVLSVAAPAVTGVDFRVTPAGIK